jgi:hypothetical protein
MSMDGHFVESMGICGNLDKSYECVFIILFDNQGRVEAPHMKYLWIS